MTDSEILKAKGHFEYGISHDIFKEPVVSYAKTALWAFEEINRQKAEIERARSALSYQKDLVERMYQGHEAFVKHAKSEAIKEFVERVKQEINFPLAVWKVFDNLVKEMTE